MTAVVRVEHDPGQPAADDLRRRARRAPRRLVGIAVLVLGLAALAPGVALGASPPPGSQTVDVYRPGVFSMQATWTWCTAASVQIMRNILVGATDRSAARQQQYFDFMRAANRYQRPAHRGVDPQGFLAGLQRFVDPGYALVATPTFDAAVHSSVTQLRRTGEPVALIVAAGRHAWVLTGFTATADPALTADFRVLSVRVVGPLYGRQSIDGYDSPPDTSISYAALRQFLLPYRFRFSATPWTGTYVTFQPMRAPSSRGVSRLAL